jgi:hypothetical protein
LIASGTASVPGTVLGAVIVITLLYVAATELAKLRFYRKFA